MIKKIILALLLLGIYQLAYKLLLVRFYLPSLLQIVNSLVTNFSTPSFYIDIFSSLQRVFVGFLVATIVGVVLGILFGYNKFFRNLRFYIELLRPIPPIAWIPIAIIIFGLGDTSSYFIVFLGAFFPIFTSTYFSVISMPEIYKYVAQSFEIGKFKYIKNVIFFYSLPHIFTGMKIGIGMAWMSVIAAELIGAQSGLGYFIQLNRLLLQTDNVVVGMLIIGIIGLLLSKLVDLIETISTPWTK